MDKTNMPKIKPFTMTKPEESFNNEITIKSSEPVVYRSHPELFILCV